MKEKRTELVFILDKSGSMSGLESDTVGGFNSMVKKQKKQPGQCRITTVLFDNEYEILHDRIDLEAVKPMTTEEYQVGGSTALLDAIGKTIRKLETIRENTDPAYCADQVLFVIITDGEENSSREYTASQVRAMISREKEQHGWEFIFLGANIDAVETAGRFGIAADRAVNYVPDCEGTALNFEVMSETVSAFRTEGRISSKPLEAIRKDERKRGRRK